MAAVILATVDWGQLGAVAAAIVIGAFSYWRTEKAAGKADRAGVDAAEAKQANADGRERAAGAEALAGFAAHQVSSLAAKSGAWDELVRGYRDMAAGQIDLVRSTNEQLEKSTDALVATERRLAECLRRDTDKDRQIEDLSGEVHELKILVSNLTGGMTKRPGT